MIANTGRKLALTGIIGIMTARAQAPSVQDLQTKLLQFEETSQRTIAELKAQIAALQQGQKPPSTASPAMHPSHGSAPQTSEVPVVGTPKEYYGTETRTRQTAGDNEAGAPRIDNEPLNPELRGYFHLPGHQHLYEVRRLRKDGSLLRPELRGDVLWRLCSLELSVDADTALGEFDRFDAPNQVQLGDPPGNPE